MKLIKKNIVVTTGIIFLIVLFFYKTFFMGLVPFPGDLLLSEYKPWRSYSFFGYNPGSIPNKAQYPDVIRQLYPWRIFGINEWKAGRAPLWNPHNFSGSPLLANFQSALLYPGNLVFWFLSEIHGWSILTIAQPAIALVGMFALSRALGYSILGSYLAAVSYAFSGFMSVWLEYNTIGHVIAWFPYAVLALEKLKKTITKQWALILIGAVTMMLLSGHPQVAGYGLVYLIVHIILSGKHRVLAIGLLLLGIMLAAVQLLPGLELLSLSARSAHSFQDMIEKILIQPWQLIMAVVPDYFGNPVTRNYWPSDTYIGKVTYSGITPFVFAIWSLFRKQSLFEKGLFATLFSIVLLTIRNPISELFYRLPLPFISTSSPNLMIYLATFCVSLLAARSFDLLKKESAFPFALRNIFVGIGIVLAIGWSATLVHDETTSSWMSHLIVARRPLLLATSIFIASFVSCYLLFHVKMRSIMSLGLIILVVFELWYFHNKFNPFVPPSYVFPQAPIIKTIKESAGLGRVWGYGTATMDANLATALSLYSPDGYDPLYPKEYGTFIHSSKRGKLLHQFDNTTRSDAVISQGFGETDLAENSYRLIILDQLNVTHILDRVENGSTEYTFPPDRFELIHSSDSWKLFRNNHALPRAYLTTNVQHIQSDQWLETHLFSPGTTEGTAFIESQSPQLNSNSDSIIPAHILHYDPTKIEIKTESQEDSFLVLSDTFSPGWVATVDNTQTKIFRTNITLRGLFVPKGNHTVLFTYQPISWYAGIFVTVLSALTVVIILAAPKRKIKKHTALSSL